MVLAVLREPSDGRRVQLVLKPMIPRPPTPSLSTSLRGEARDDASGLQGGIRHEVRWSTLFLIH